MVEFRIHVAIEENAKSVAGTFLRKLVLKILELILSCKDFFFFFCYRSLPVMAGFDFVFLKLCTRQKDPSASG